MIAQFVYQDEDWAASPPGEADFPARGPSLNAEIHSATIDQEADSDADPEAHSDANRVTDLDADPDWSLDDKEDCDAGAKALRGDARVGRRRVVLRAEDLAEDVQAIRQDALDRGWRRP